MKFAIPEISWHNRDPVLSVDFQPKSDASGPQRLATGGTDSHVLIWYVSSSDTGSVHLEVAADLSRHQKAVNVVRWSPSGQLLASGDDESIIFVWRQKDEEPVQVEQGEEQYKETWVIFKTLRGHMEDVLDLSWSSCSLYLASGSVDNKLIVWDVSRGKHMAILTDHKGFVQGVAWDPKGQIIATASTDRVFRTFDISTKKVVSRSSKAVLPFPPSHPLHNTTVRLFHDDTLQTYYRRLQFSPDGLLIAVPAGRIEPEGKMDGKPINAVYIFTRHCLKTPVCILPSVDSALVTRWSPRTYALKPGPAALPIDKRMVLAVATKRSVLIYDTQQKTPIAMISNIHYTRLTDLTWSPDGCTLVASSTDGFCSVVTFGEDELGAVLPEPVARETTGEPMDVDERPAEMEPTQNPEPKDVKPATEPNTNKESKGTPKIDSYMKFKAPATEKKSPKNKNSSKTETKKQKTPVKLDVLVETAMQSWSDNSNNDIIKTPGATKDVEIVEIEDSNDMKLVYEDTVNTSELPENKDSQAKIDIQEPADDTKDNNKESKENESATETGKSPESKTTPPKPVSSPSSRTFFSQAKVTDVREAATQAAPSPRAPRRVSFVTLSSPKNKKNKTQNKD